MFGPVGRTQPATATPFDNSTNGFASQTTQAAIEEVVSFVTNPIVDQSYYVSKNGNDTTGNGTFGRPYLTIAKALTVITDSSTVKRYVIIVGPGTFAEDLTLKANVFIKGANPMTTIINGTTVNINDATWNVSTADNRSGFQDITINNAIVLDFTTQAGNDAGKIFCHNIRVFGAITSTAKAASNQLSIFNSVLNVTVTSTGMSTSLNSTTFNTGANLVLNSSGTASIPTTAFITDGATLGNITATWTSNSAVTLNLRGLKVGPTTVLTASGASCSILANDGSLPVPANRSFSSGATLTRVNDNYADGLLSATTNVLVSSAAAPTAGQALVATGPSAAAWSNVIGLLTSNTVVTGAVTTTSSTDSLLNGMTITPAAGTYLILFNSDIDSNAAGAAISVSVYIGGTQVASTLRKIIPFDGGALSAGDARGIAATQHIATVNGSQAIEIRWSISSGTASAANRSLITLRVA